MPYVLIVDDDVEFAHAIATVLKEKGYQVAVEFDVAGGLASMAMRRPDLVILDVMFPEDMTGGFSLARKMKHYREEFKGVPVLMLTAINRETPLQFGPRDIDQQWLPVSDFMNKPVDFDEMFAKISNLLGKEQDKMG